MIIFLLIPLIAAILALSNRNTRAGEYASVLSSGLLSLFTVLLARKVLSAGDLKFWGGVLYIDALSAYMLLVISFLSLAASVYSIEYMRNELARAEGIRKTKTLRMYYCLLNLFVFTMMLVPVVNSLALLWIAIEATTLVSAVLVGIYRKQESIEAAWKYIILCTVGITFALMGTFIMYYASTEALGAEAGTLNWTGLLSAARKLNPATVKLSFILIMVGYGTKAGLAPVHNWLPDAHSEAPTPISALLSGILLNCAFYGVMRFSAITDRTCGHLFLQGIMAFFGISSILLAAIFILIQSNAKRLLAYSSIEHMGFISLSFGIGGALGIYASLLHILNHALAKPLMFFVTGRIHSVYHSLDTRVVKGVLATIPFVGVIGFAGLMAITGVPPFNVFVSEFLMLKNFAAGGHWYILSIFLAGSAVVFYGFLKWFGGMLLGPKADHPVPNSRPFGPASVVMACLLIGIILLGFYIPGSLDRLLNLSTAALGNG